MNIPLEHHAVCNDAPGDTAGDAAMTLHPYTIIHDRMEGGGKPGCRWSIALQQLRSGHSLKALIVLPHAMRFNLDATAAQLAQAAEERGEQEQYYFGTIHCTPTLTFTFPVYQEVSYGS